MIKIPARIAICVLLLFCQVIEQHDDRDAPLFCFQNDARSLLMFVDGNDVIRRGFKGKNLLRTFDHHLAVAVAIKNDQFIAKLI